MSKATTIPQHFLHSVQKYGDDKVALRQKEFGIWREFTWEHSFEEVRAFALGLMVLGLERGDHVAAIGDNDRQYLWAYLGLLAVGGVQVGLYTDANADEAAYIIDHSDAQFVLAQDQEQVDKMLDIRAKIPDVKKVIYWDDRGLWDYDDKWLISYDEVQALGRELLQSEPTRFETEVGIGRGDDMALMCYTSGTTGLPKGAMITHENIISVGSMFQDIEPRYETDNHVSFLPLGWIVEHTLGVAPHCVYGIIMNFPEEPETVRENIREIAPEGLVYNSRLWDNIVSLVQVRMLDATWLNRKLYDVFLPIGYRYADRQMRGETVGVGLKSLYSIGDLLVFGPLRDKLGLSRVRSAYTGGAALSPDVMRWYHALGVNLKQAYGSTEVCGGIIAHYDNDIKFASLGKPMPGANMQISDEGEIMLASPTLFQGYYKNAEKSAEDIHTDPDGTRWFKTGDAGYIDDDGHLIYLDRVKDMITLSNDERFSPQFIEGRLKFNPYIKEVMAIGDPTRDVVTALIIIDFDNIGKWAEKRNLGYTTFADLSQKQPVIELVEAAVKEVNTSLPAAGRVKSFVLMHKEFDADEAEMTRSRKLRRGFLAQRYDTIIDALYSNTNTVSVQSPVTYQDGTVGYLENELKIVRL